MRWERLTCMGHLLMSQKTFASPPPPVFEGYQLLSDADGL